MLKLRKQHQEKMEPLLTELNNFIVDNIITTAFRGRMYIMQKFKLFFVVFSLFFILSTVESVFAYMDMRLNARYKTNLSISPLPTVNTECTLTLTIESFSNSPNTYGTIHIPDAFEIVDGNTKFNCNLDKGETYTHSMIIKLKKEGKYFLFANIKSSNFVYGYVQNDRTELYVVSTNTTLSANKEPDESYFEPKLDINEFSHNKLITTETKTTISGTITYVDGEGITRPLIHTRVQLYNSLGQAMVDGWAYTNDNGYYEISCQGQAAFFNIVKEVSNGNNHAIGYITNTGHCFFINDLALCGMSSGDKILNNSSSQTQHATEQAHLLQLVCKSYEWCEENLGWTRPAIEIKYYPGSPNRDNNEWWQFVHQQHPWENHWIEYFNHYIDSDDRTINYVWGDHGKTILAHEYGHAVRYYAFGNDLPLTAGGGTLD